MLIIDALHSGLYHTHKIKKKKDAQVLIQVFDIAPKRFVEILVLGLINLNSFLLLDRKNFTCQELLIYFVHFLAMLVPIIEVGVVLNHFQEIALLVTQFDQLCFIFLFFLEDGVLTERPQTFKHTKR